MTVTREPDFYSCALRLATFCTLLACAACGDTEPSVENIRSVSNTASLSEPSAEENIEGEQAFKGLYTRTADKVSGALP